MSGMEEDQPCTGTNVVLEQRPKHRMYVTLVNLRANSLAGVMGNKLTLTSGSRTQLLMSLWTRVSFRYVIAQTIRRERRSER